MSPPRARPAVRPYVAPVETIASILTPENVPVRFAVARLGDRAAAFAIDAAILLAALVFVGLLGFGLASFSDSGSLGMAIVILAAFVLRNFYFTWFEIRRQGQTPGKRKLLLRVIDRRGGSLTAESVFVRNVMREIEFFIPLVAIVAPHLLFPVGGGLGRLLALAWVFVLAAMPLFNRERLRVGDLVAGTMVVRLPEPRLLPELSTPAPRTPHVFTPEQLDVYGIYELQVLEDLLRGAETGAERGETREAALAAVGAKIRRKIGYGAGPSSGRDAEEEFLRDFYAAQRARLEGKMLLGTRQERKKS